MTTIRNNRPPPPPPPPVRRTESRQTPPAQTQNPAMTRSVGRDGFETKTNPLASAALGSAQRTTPTRGTTLAQAPSAQQYGVQTPFGAVRVRVNDSSFQNPETGLAHNLRVYEIKRAGEQTEVQFATSPQNATETDRLINQAAGWVHSSATTSSLPGFRPETVQLTVGDNGVASMQRWMSNGREGRLVGVSVKDPRLGEGFVDVPPAVFNALPEGRGRDVTREGGTEYNLRTAQLQRDGRTEQVSFWEASHLQRNEQNELERVTYQFTPGDNQLGLVRTDRPDGSTVYKFGEHYERIPGPRNNLQVGSGSAVTYGSDSAEVVNAAGTQLDFYREVSEGQYERTSRHEHLLSNGRSTDLRLIHNEQDNLFRLVRDKGGGSYEAVVDRLETAADGTPILPRSALGNLDPSTLSTPSTRFTVGQAPSRPTGDLAPRLVDLDYDAFKFSRREGSLAERFRDPNAPFQTRTVVINGETRQMELLDAQAKSRYVDRNGVEYIARNENGTLHVENVNRTSVIGSPAQAYSLPPDAFIIPSSGERARDLMPKLAAMGLEPVAVLGTGFISAQTGADGKTNPALTQPVGYSYFDPRKLGITENIPPADRTDDALTSGVIREGGVIREDGLGSDNIHSGYYTQRVTNEQGKVEFRQVMLDFPDEGNNDRASIRQQLKELEARPDVVAINLFAHHSASSVDQLVGIMGTEPDTGQRNVADGEDLNPTGILDSRAFMVFNGQGEQLGIMFTPKMAIRDTLEAARQTYGEDVRVQNFDGDFYAQRWFADGREDSSRYALNYQNAFIVVRPTEGFRPARVPEEIRDPKLDELYQRGLEADDAEDQNQRTSNPLEALGELWRRRFGGGN
ncbi:MAG TPA: hypothetical protein VFZ09_11085 [Archangium sp.]|uniref:hypothetical protein n=1 Tax=Archangium sp. TaxID=1872627 RepID=UPI002E3537F6|nr:hypothetical protein [Archangium sp.]HEX5746782.1 hypothetical protein [Archangium sp.]